MKLRDPSGRLRLPAYILIALVITLAAILLVAAGLLLAPSQTRERRRAVLLGWPEALGWVRPRTWPTP